MSMTSVRNKIRYLLGDNSTTGYDLFTYNASAVFNLSEDSIISIDSVFKNEAEQNDSGFYTYNATNNKITIIGSITAGDSLQVNYTYYPNYSTSELNNYLQAALVHLSINNYYDFSYDTTDDAVYPEMEVREENLLARVTALLINPDNKSIRLPDVAITVPNDYPVDKKINMLIATFKKDSSGIFSILSQ